MFELDVTMGWWYNWTVYQEPANYTYGNTKRDSIYGPSWKQVDMSLIKNINIREKVNLKLKLEAFDALNYGNWPNPGTGIAEESGTYLDGIGTSTLTSKITSRNVQVGVDLSF